MNVKKAAMLMADGSYVCKPTFTSGLAWLIEAVGTLSEAETPDMAVLERISAEIGDETLGPPGTLPSA